MLLLDDIDDYGEEWLRAVVRIRSGSVFFTPPAGVPTYAGIEYMAQTASAHGGLECAQRGVAPPIALLLGCREYRCARTHFGAGMQLRIEARRLLRDESDFVAYECSIWGDGEPLARSILKAVRPHNLASVIQSQWHDS